MPEKTKLMIRTSDELLSSAPKNATALIVATLAQKLGNKGILRRVALGWQTTDARTAIYDAAAQFSETAYLTQGKSFEHGSENTFRLQGATRNGFLWCVQLLAMNLVRCYAKYEDAGELVVAKPVAAAPAKHNDQEFMSILAVCSDRPEELRCTDLDRVLELAHDQKKLHEFAGWLFGQELKPETRVMLESKAPREADGHITLFRQDGTELLVSPDGVALMIEAVKPATEKPVDKSELKFLPIDKIAYSTKHGFDGIVSAANSDYVTDGKSLMVKTACDPKLLATLSPAKQFKYCVKPPPETGMLHLFRRASEDAKLDGEINGYVMGRDINGFVGADVPVVCISVGMVVLAADGHRVRFIQKITGADAVKIQDATRPIVFYKAGKPVALLSPIRTNEAADVFKLMLASARARAVVLDYCI